MNNYMKILKQYCSCKTQILNNLIFASISLFITNSAVAGYFEVRPETSEWDVRFNNCGSYWIDSQSRCEAAGGEWTGGYANPYCPGGDFAAFKALPIVTQVKNFSIIRYRLCPAPIVTFTGEWGQTNAEGCWDTRPRETSLGVETKSQAYLSVSGFTRPDTACQTSFNTTIIAYRSREVTCPVDSSPLDLGQGQRCYKLCPDGQMLVNGLCDSPPEKGSCNGKGANYTNNPCNVATGNKYRSETDISGSSLDFTRHYNSAFLYRDDYGVGWRSNFQKEIVEVGSGSMVLVSPAGRGDPWRKVNGVWQGDSDSKIVLIETATGYRVTMPNGAYDDYNIDGRLVSQTDINNKQRILGYNPQGQLASVTNQYGHTLTFDYANRQLSRVTDALGQVTEYKYDVNRNLEQVIYPDDTPSISTDNPRKTYHYEDANYPNHLTGITDENGDRYATFAYNANGQAILSKLGTTTNNVGQGKIELDFQTGAQQ